MRRQMVTLIVLVLFLALAYPAWAQAPTVKVNGYIHDFGAVWKNLSFFDNNATNDKDESWHNQTRAHIQVEATASKDLRGVIRLEFDTDWGQFGRRSNVGRGGTSGGAGANTDVRGISELKWAFIDFAVPGLPTRLQAGLIPQSVTYKGAVLASGDVAGVNAYTDIAPGTVLNLHFAQYEEAFTAQRGATCGEPYGGTASACLNRGEDWSAIASLSLSPAKGIDIRPLLGFLRLSGTAGTGVAAADGVSGGTRRNEDRYYVGVDSKLKFGDLFLDPTFIYEGGTRDISGATPEQDIKAWLLDIRGGYKMGNLLIEGLGVYSPGNKATDHPGAGTADVKYYEPINTDAGQQFGWWDIWGLGVSYHMKAFPFGSARDQTFFGFERYGRMQASARVSYAFTNTFRGRVTAGQFWTAEKVDTSGTIGAVNTGSGKSTNIGFAVEPGFLWTVYPGLTLNAVFAYLSAGDALGQSGEKPKDMWKLGYALSYSF